MTLLLIQFMIVVAVTPLAMIWAVSTLTEKEITFTWQKYFAALLITLWIAPW